MDILLESLTKKRKQKAYFRKEVQVAQLVTANEWKKCVPIEISRLKPHLGSSAVERPLL